MANTSASSPINPHFLQPLLPGFLSHINIPMAFYTKHIKGTTDEGNANVVVKLRSDASDLTWEVHMDGRRLTQGWQNFATVHDLGVGDIVIFRHDGDLLFHVTAFGPSCCEIQYDDDDIVQISSDSDSEKNQDAREAGSPSDKSCFVARVTPSNLRKDELFLPRAFSRSNGLTNRECEIILLNENGKPRIALLKYHKTHGHAYLRRGWRNFCLENRKRANDLLTFKLVQNGTKPVLQLCSSMYNRDAAASSSSSSSSYSSYSSYSTSQDRLLTLTLTPYNLKKFKLCLPVKFVRLNGIENARKITLVDRYGIKTATNLKPDNKYGRMRLGKEWREFCEVNGVKAGDSFKLELIKEEEDTATHLLRFCNKV